MSRWGRFSNIQNEDIYWKILSHFLEEEEKNFSKQIFRSETISETFEAVACQKKLKTKKV